MRMSEVCGGFLGDPEGYQKIFPPCTSVVSPTVKSLWSKMKELNIVSSYIRLLRSSDFVTMLDEQSENITDVYP